MPKLLLLLPLALALLGCNAMNEPSWAAEEPIINGQPLTPEQLDGFRQLYGVVPEPGRYWYDPMSGIWGYEGRGGAGFLLPGLPLGALSEGASGGTTGVVINGRRLPADEVMSWQWMLGTQILPGRYWLDHQGNYGAEGIPFAAGNVLALLAQRGGGGGGGGGRDNFWSSRLGAGNHDPNTGAGYVSVPGHGPIGYGM